jgi:hypothetical protein
MKQPPSVFLSVFVLAALLLGACEQPAGSNPAWEAAEAFRARHAAILAKTESSVVVDDEAAVNAALAAHRSLGADAQALVAGEKALLDSLSARIDALKGAQAAAEAYKTAHAAALDKTAAAVAIDDEAAVAAALADWEALAADARALLAGEKALLDSLQGRINALKGTQAAAEAYKTAHAAILSRTEASVMPADEPAVAAALADWEALAADARALLVAEKALLDSLKTKLEQLQGDSPAQDAARAYKTAHSNALERTLNTVGIADEPAVAAALADWGALAADAQALLAAEKALLDSLGARIGALKDARAAAAAFTTAHAAVLSTATAALALTDEAAVAAALADWEALAADAQALLAGEKALLDSHKARLSALKAGAFTTAHAAILSRANAALTIADGDAANAALAAYNALDGETQALLAGEKALLDSHKARIDTLLEAAAFTTAHAAILSRASAALTAADGAAVNAALTAYAALGADARALLAGEKALLDSHRARLDALAEAAAFTTAHAAILSRASAALTAADEAAVDRALAAFAALGADARALLAAEKALLDSHRARISDLKAAAFKAAHAAILSKASAALALADETAVNAALAAHNALDAGAQALLAGEKALLDSHRARLNALKAAAFTTAHAAILSKTTANLVVADEPAVDAALAAYRALDGGAQALLAGEKALLDSLATRIDALKEAAAFKTAHAAVLSKTTANVAASDEAGVDGALAAYNALGAETRALLAGEKALLDSLKIKIEQLNSGDPEDFIVLLNAMDLAMIGVNMNYPPDGNYILAADIELRDWKPVGSVDEPFSGFFDGKGYAITLKGFDESIFYDGENHSPGLGAGIFGWTRGSPEAPARIRNLTVKADLFHVVTETDACYVGALVGYADEYTELRNITVEGSVNFTNKNTGSPQRPIYVGGIAGALIASELKDSVAGAAVTGAGMAGDGQYNYVGGAVGVFDRNQVEWGLNPAPIIGVPFAGSSIVNCRVAGNVEGRTEGSNIFVGGVAGGAFYGMKTYYGGKIEGCSSTGRVAASGGGLWTWAGGIAATISGDGHDDPEAPAAGAALTGPTRIVRCYATGVVTADGPRGSWPYAGGIVGNNYYGGLVSQCWFDGAVKAAGDGISDYTGGIAGYNSKQYGHGSRIEDCWTAGSVEGYLNAGGIVGQNQVAALVVRCYSRALVSARAAAGAAGSQAQQGAGGIAGYNSEKDAEEGVGTVQNCAALNPSITASGGFELLNRVVGNGGGSHRNNLARQDMAIIIGGPPAAPGDTGPDAAGGADCAAQPSQSAYEALGWDFGSVWRMSGDYPVLRWQ